MLLLELEPAVDPAVNRLAVSAAAAIREQGPRGVRDVRATYRSVAVDYDPLQADRDGIGRALEAALAPGSALAGGHELDIPVVYGGDSGPDLEEVATRSGLSASAVVERHAAPSYLAFMLGFMPGFAYLGPVAPSLVGLRRATPRLRVPAGSVGVAGRQTGIYPRECPGGWEIIGRTNAVLFDPTRTPAARIQPGDRVRFVPVDRLDPLPPVESPRVAQHAVPSVTVIMPGLLTTVQDAGRWGHQSIGVPVGGALDARALTVANAAVGNPHDAAAIEVTLTGLELRFERPCTVAIAGADLGAELNGAAAPLHAPLSCRPGSRLRFAERRAGARAYLALAGGVDVPLVLGSRSTELGAGFGGVLGRALRAGDQLGIGVPLQRATPSSSAPLPSASRGAPTVLRVLAGPHDEWFDSAALEALERQRFTVTPQSNRVGYRLSAPAPLARRDSGEMISDATVAGGIQVPPDGQPILLMADRQVTGGYPILATVITADLSLAAQLAPGDAVTFEICSRGVALAALRQAESP